MVAATYIERLEAVIACFSFSSVFQRYIQGDKESILAIKSMKDNGKAYNQIFQIIKSALDEKPVIWRYILIMVR